MWCAGVQGAAAPGQVQVRLPRPGVRIRPRLPARHTPGHEEAHLPAPGDDDGDDDDNDDDDDDDDGAGARILPADAVQRRHGGGGGRQEG